MAAPHTGPHTGPDAGPQDPEPVAEDLARRFAERFGRAPTTVCRAPGRVNLIGEHVDYNGGRCLPMALTQSTFVAAAARDDDRVTVVTLQDGEDFAAGLADVVPGKVDGWAAYAAGVLWALREDGLDVPGVDLLVDGRVPLGSGLSSSAALECSVALAVTTLLGLDDDEALRRRLVEACVRTEREVAGAPTGGLDQTVSLLASAEEALLVDFADGSLRGVPWRVARHDVDLLVVNTNVQHALGDGGYSARRRDCEEAAGMLGVEHLAEVTDLDAALARLEGPDADRLRRRTTHVVREVARVDAAVAALERDDLTEVGRLFVASHVSLRDDYEVSCDELDMTVETAVAHGALGARMTGGGFGGCAIVLVPHDRAEEVTAAVEAAFAERGWPHPDTFSAVAAGAASVLL